MAPDKAPSGHVSVASRQLQELSLTARALAVAERAATRQAEEVAPRLTRLGDRSARPLQRVGGRCSRSGRGQLGPETQGPASSRWAQGRPATGSCCPSVPGVACCAHVTSWNHRVLWPHLSLLARAHSGRCRRALAFH